MKRLFSMMFMCSVFCSFLFWQQPVAADTSYDQIEIKLDGSCNKREGLKKAFAEVRDAIKKCEENAPKTICSYCCLSRFEQFFTRNTCVHKSRDSHALTCKEQQRLWHNRLESLSLAYLFLGAICYENGMNLSSQERLDAQNQAIILMGKEICDDGEIEQMFAWLNKMREKALSCKCS